MTASEQLFRVAAGDQRGPNFARPCRQDMLSFGTPKLQDAHGEVFRGMAFSYAQAPESGFSLSRGSKPLYGSTAGPKKDRGRGHRLALLRNCVINAPRNPSETAGLARTSRFPFPLSVFSSPWPTLA